MAITRGKMGKVSFLHKLEIRKLCLKLVSFLHKLETKVNYAWNRFHFYTSLKWKQTMLENWFHFYTSLKLENSAWKTGKNGHAPNMVTQFEVHTPQASVHMKGGWSEGSITRSRERLNWDFMRSNQNLEWNRNVFHCFFEVDTLKNYPHELIHFLTRLT